MAVRLASDAARPARAGGAYAARGWRARGTPLRPVAGAYPPGRDGAARSQAAAGPQAGGTAARGRRRGGTAAPGPAAPAGSTGGAPGGAGRRTGGGGAGRGRPLAARPHVHLDPRQRRAGPGRGGLGRLLRRPAGGCRRRSVAALALVPWAGG